MPEWKKVVVSGSNISQLNNDAGYVTAATTPNGFATASIGGVNLIADSVVDTLNFASSSGQGLTISGSAGNDTLTFGLSAVPNASLANSSVTVTAGSGLSGGGSVALGASTSLSVNSSSMATYFNSSSWAGVSGDILINASTGVATIQANSVALGTDTTGNYVQSIVPGNGITATSGSSESADVTINVVYGSSANTAVQGNTNITINGTANEVEITGTAAQALGGGPSYTIGLPNSVTISNDLTVGGNLVVNGTASFQNTQNLLVADRFVLFASGSVSTGDGGIVVQQATQNVGEVYGYDSTATRWGFATSFNATSSNFTPTVFVGAVQTGTGQTAGSAAPTYGGSGNGWGTIHIDTDDGEIWIYS